MISLTSFTENDEPASEFVQNIEETAETALGAFETVEESFEENINRFNQREGTAGVQQSERWDNAPEDYNVGLSFQDAGHDLSEVDLRVDLDGVPSPTEVTSDNMAEYIDEMKQKVNGAAERLSLAESKANMLEEGEEAAKGDLLESLLRGTDRYEDDVDPERLNRSAAAEDNQILEDIESLDENGTEILDRHIAQVNQLETAYESHIEQTAEQYHEDAKEQVTETSEAFQEAVDELVETARAVDAVRDNTMDDPNYLSEDVAQQRPVIEAGEQALYTKANEVMEYVAELRESADDIQYVAEELGGVLEEDDLDCMKTTAASIRTGVVDKLDSASEDYLGDVEYDSAADYVVDVVRNAGFETETQNLDGSLFDDEYRAQA